MFIGAKTKRSLLKYRRAISHAPELPLFQTIRGDRLSANGLRSILIRRGKEVNLVVNPHMLRRTFATLSLKAGMNIVHLQGLLGHSSLEMTRRYVQMIDEDLETAHLDFGPIDSL